MSALNIAPNINCTRNKTIDAAKGIGIFLVVFAHLNYIQPWQNIIYSFHMPLFFILAGMMFRKEKYPTFRSFFKKRFQTLICPYLLFAFLSFGYEVLITLLSDGINLQVLHKLGSSFLEIFWARYSLVMTFNVPMWFIPCLFLLESIYYFVSKIKNRALFFTSIVLIVTVGWFTESKYCPIDFSVLPWSTSSACFALGFYTIGNLTYSKIIRITEHTYDANYVLKKIVIIVICMAMLVPLALYNGHVTIGSRTLGNGFVFYITGILGTSAVILLASIVQNFSLLTFWGRNSFYIMATHKIFQSMLFVLYKILFNKLLDFSTEQWIPNLIVLSIVLIASSFFVVFYNKLKNILKEHQYGRTA